MSESEKKLIYILYGVNEGPAMSKKFRKACIAAGFTISKDIETADILFAHSGGCLLIPSRPHAQAVFLIGLAYWPGKPWLKATKYHLKDETKASFKQKQYFALALKWTYRAVYFFKVPTTLKMGKNQNMDAPWNNSQKQTLIRNRYDEYCDPNIFKEPFKGSRTFISLPGSHDDCWDNPDVYIELMKATL